MDKSDVYSEKKILKKVEKKVQRKLFLCPKKVQKKRSKKKFKSHQINVQTKNRQTLSQKKCEEK